MGKVSPRDIIQSADDHLDQQVEQPARAQTSASDDPARDRYWRALGKQIQQGAAVRVNIK